ncbi:molybdate ABC transporter substrate-binding protein [Ramlibacter monticola]|uniref:Molybdate ABC transporter substrate-binding protein n=1 Tax=Ramlibacter monticola TaxID=1926872 RepID=A0A936Z6K2_9BURK|nr:molybdate ABC transporter substrate-binding protein [Ramlibacter monticola]MBL0394977.1 molybdate ABC transporter substrate-binding protein [Ramlibacter monticola]
MTILRRAPALAIALLTATALHAGQVRVAVAANLGAPMQRIASDFGWATGHEAVVALGSTGRLYAQMRGGAPFEVLLAADQEVTSRVERDGLAVPGSRFTYAVGRLVLWSLDPNGVDGQGNVLKRAPHGRLAVADPLLAPYGMAANQTLVRLGVLPAWQTSLLQGESVAQAYQFVATGSATLGFIALSQVMSEGRISRGSAWIVPSQLHDPLRQEAVLLNAGRSNPAATALMDYLKTEPARAVLRAYGYEVPKP